MSTNMEGGSAREVFSSSNFVLPYSRQIFSYLSFPIHVFTPLFSLHPFSVLLFVVMEAASSIIAVVSVAIQLAESIKKLVIFFKDVRDAPSEVNALLDDLEILYDTLQQVGAFSGDSRSSKIIERALQSCNTEVHKLDSKLSDAARNIKSENICLRKWSAFGIVLKKSQIESLRKAIEQAKSTLTLALVQ